MPCPFCRRNFRNLENIVTKFRTNWLISELIERKTLDEQTVNENTVMCVCSADGDKDPDEVAEWYCAYCGEKLCDQCCNAHKKQRLTKDPQLLS